MAPTQLGKDPATASKWCTNASQPTLETMMLIAKMPKVSIEDLVRFEALPDVKIKEEQIKLQEYALKGRWHIPLKAFSCK